MQKLIDKWKLIKMTGLTDEAEKARDYLMSSFCEAAHEKRTKTPTTSSRYYTINPNLNEV
jgi:acyl-[acyl-carrier-protein] desaturase